MKLAKLSLVAAMLMGTSAFALEVTEVKGAAKLYYGTSDANDADFFSKNGAYGNGALELDLGMKLGESASAKFGMSYLTTMGLEDTLVMATWAGSDLEDAIWIDEANIAFTPIEKTTLVVGRQALDTPLAFTETWNIVSNTFDAAVVVDQHLPETTLVAAWVGRYNGCAGSVVCTAADKDLGGEFVDFHQTARDKTLGILAEGAYAVGAVTSLIPSVTAQAWYYDVVRTAQAFWIQADADVEGIQLGAQFASVSPDEDLMAALGAPDDSTDAYAFKAAFATDAFTVSGAFSQTTDGGVLDVANTGTGAGTSALGANPAQSKLYTEAWWNYGYVGQPDTTAYTLAAEAGLAGFDLGAYFTSTSNDTTDIDMTELTLTAGSSVGALDYTVAFIMTDADDQNLDANGDADAYNTLQAYLTYNF